MSSSNSLSSSSGHGNKVLYHKEEPCYIFFLYKLVITDNPYAFNVKFILLIMELSSGDGSGDNLPSFNANHVNVWFLQQQVIF